MTETTDKRPRKKRRPFKPHKNRREHASRNRKKKYKKDLQQSLKDLQKHFNDKYHSV